MRRTAFAIVKRGRVQVDSHGQLYLFNTRGRARQDVDAANGESIVKVTVHVPPAQRKKGRRR